MFKKVLLTVVGTIFIALFIMNVIAGLLLVYEREWCQPGEFCAEAWNMLWAALEIALIASFAAVVGAWLLRAMLVGRRVSVLMLIGVTASASLFITLDFALTLKASLATQIFPHVVGLRFGLLGTFIVWGTFGLLVCIAIMRAVVQIDNLIGRSNK